MRIGRGEPGVYNLAADMGGMGFIENNRALCMLSVLINTHMLVASRDAGVERIDYLGVIVPTGVYAAVVLRSGLEQQLLDDHLGHRVFPLTEVMETDPSLAVGEVHPLDQVLHLADVDVKDG